MARSVLRVPAAILLVVLAVAAGVGWLYLLRHWHALGAGHRFAGALPLQRLARGDAQPLGRLVLAWLPAGVVAALALAGIGVRSRAARVVTVGLVALATIFLASAVSEAVTGSEPLAQHLSPVAGRAALWLAAGLMALGALIAPPWGRRDSGPVRATGATRRGGGASAGV